MADDKKHEGRSTLVLTDDGVEEVELKPHDEVDCAQVCEEAAQRVRGHETVFEAEDAGAARASVGYSKSYAAGYDAVFGKDGKN